jgi:hypothetical protein
MTLKDEKLASAAPLALAAPSPDQPPDSARGPAVAVAPKLRNIAIIGTAPLSRPFAPTYKQPDSNGNVWELWVLGNPIGEKPLYDRFYEIHHPSTLIHPQWADYYQKWLPTVECPVWAFHPLPGVKNVHLIPRAEIEEEFGPWFQTSSVTWAISHALLEHISDPDGSKGQKIGRLGFWGVEMATTSEYAEQKPGCLHWIWVAQRMLGIKISLPNVSELCITGLPYPFNVESPAYNRVAQRRDLLDLDLKKCRDAIENLARVLAKLEGAREELRAQERTLVTPV